MSKKTRAARLLTRYIRDIAAEATIPVGDAAADNGVRMETRAEALARMMWKMAEGYTEEVGKNKDGTNKIKVHPPDKGMITIIIERMEGRVPTIDAKDQKSKASVAERVSEQAKKRMSAVVKGDDASKDKV